MGQPPSTKAEPDRSRRITLSKGFKRNLAFAVTPGHLLCLVCAYRDVTSVQVNHFQIVDRDPIPDDWQWQRPVPGMHNHPVAGTHSGRFHACMHGHTCVSPSTSAPTCCEFGARCSAANMQHDSGR